VEDASPDADLRWVGAYIGCEYHTCGEFLSAAELQSHHCT
jgi:hypothetical protein